MSLYTWDSRAAITGEISGEIIENRILVWFSLMFKKMWLVKWLFFKQDNKILKRGQPKNFFLGNWLQCQLKFAINSLAHWRGVMHICVCKPTIIGSDNGLLPGWCQGIIGTNAGILLTGPLATNFSEILIESHTFSLKKMHFKMPSEKWWPFCLSLNVLRLGEVYVWLKWLINAWGKFHLFKANSLHVSVLNTVHLDFYIRKCIWKCCLLLTICCSILELTSPHTTEWKQISIIVIIPNYTAEMSRLFIIYIF